MTKPEPVSITVAAYFNIPPHHIFITANPFLIRIFRVHAPICYQQYRHQESLSAILVCTAYKQVSGTQSKEIQENNNRLHLWIILHYQKSYRVYWTGCHFTLWNSLCATCRDRRWHNEHHHQENNLSFVYCTLTQWSRACRKSKSSSVHSSSVLDLVLTRASQSSRRSLQCTQCSVSSHLALIASKGS